MNADQMYQVLKQLMIPHTFASKYWSGKVFSPNDKQRARRAEQLGRAARARRASDAACTRSTAQMPVPLCGDGPGEGRNDGAV